MSPGARRRRIEGSGGVAGTPPSVRKGWTVYARSTTVDGRPDAVAAAVTHIREQVMPAVLRADGYVGLSTLVDRASGGCVLTTAWRTEEALQAADQLLRPHRDRVAELLGGCPEDEEWEIAVLHRAHASRPGACVRTVRIRVEPEQAGHEIDLHRMLLLPQISAFEGFCSTSLLVDRPSGHAVSSVTFDDHDAMRRTRTLAAVTREPGSAETIGEILEVAEFDLALAHLHVPELV